MAACCNRRSFNLFEAFLLFFIVIIPITSYANIAEYDEYWTQRKMEAQNNTNMAYRPFPEEITHHLNFNVARTLEGLNSTRRVLKGKRKGKGKGKGRGHCEATNPIDQCWRCDKEWLNNRKRLADCALGFGRDTTGGKNGAFYEVTTPIDDNAIDPKPGTLRYAVTRKRPLWIIFKRSMLIKLNHELIMQGDKTIDCRGATVHIAFGSGITIQFVKNVIIHGCHIHNIVPTSGGMIRDAEDHFGLRTHTDGDGVSIFGSSNVWLDHLSLHSAFDGLIDAIMGSTAVTISNCHFTHQNAVMLLSASDSHFIDKKMQITLCFNRFGSGCVQRMPRSRHGFVHIVNNDYHHWLMYAIGGSAAPTVISQGNRFAASPNPFTKEVTKRDYSPPEVWKKWDWRSDGDLMLNGAFFNQSGNPSTSKKYAGRFKMKPFSSKKTFKLTRHAGTLRCHNGHPC